jgi:hypothetical protein
MSLRFSTISTWKDVRFFFSFICFRKVNVKFVLFVFIPISHDVNLAILRNTMAVSSGAGSSCLCGTPDFNLIFLVSSHCSNLSFLCRVLSAIVCPFSCFFCLFYCLSFDMHVSSDPSPLGIFILIYCKTYTHYRHLLKSVLHELLVIIFVRLWTFVVSYPDYSIVHLSLI